MPASSLAASCASLVKVYGTASGEVHALKGIDASFSRGAVTAVVGPSGSGKSTLLRMLAGLDRPTAGRVSLAGKELGALSGPALHRLRRRHVGYVFQRPSDNLVPYLDAEQHLSGRGRAGRDPHELLTALGLAHRRSHRPRELSGGEQQRLAFAQAVVSNPTLVLADEPTAELDTATGEEVLTQVRALAEQGIGFVIATHDQKVVQAADAVLELWHGAVLSETHGEVSLSVIDDAGRIQLPEEALERFPDRRAVLRIEGDDVVISPP